MLGGLGRGCQISRRSFWVSCALLVTSCPSCCVRPPGRDAMVLGEQLGGMLPGGTWGQLWDGGWGEKWAGGAASLRSQHGLPALFLPMKYASPPLKQKGFPSPL